MPATKVVTQIGEDVILHSLLFGAKMSGKRFGRRFYYNGHSKVNVIELRDINPKGVTQMTEVLQKNSNISSEVDVKTDWKKWVLPAVLSVILFLAAIWGIENFNQLLLYDDEFGYWAASAYLTGTDWQSVTSGIPYYSYGYGFLILTPIRLLFSTPATMYRAAIVVNGLLLVGSFYIARSVANQLFEEVHYALIDVVCLLVMLYPSNIVFSHIAWAECTLVFVFWAFVWLSLRVIKKPSVLNHAMLAVVVMGLYVVHQRTLAVAIATVMIMLWCFFTDKDRREKVIVFGVVMLVLMLVHSTVKGNLIEEFYNNNAKVAKNNLEGQTDNLLNLFTGEGIFALLRSAVGKWFYLFTATIMMAWWGAEFFWDKAKAWLGQNLAGGKTRRYNRTLDVSLWYVWLLLTFGGNFLILAISMSDLGRNDVLLYGRYIEYMIGVYLIIGIIAFLKDEKWEAKYMTYIVLAIISGIICQNVLNAKNIKLYQPYHSIFTSLFLEKDKSAAGAIWGYTAFSILFSMCIIMVVKAQPWRRADWLRKGVAIVSVSGLFLIIAFNTISGVMTEKQELRIENITNVVSWVEDLDAEEEYKVYYCSGTESRYWSESFQFLLGDRPLTVISTNKIDAEEDALYFVGNSFLKTDDFDEEYYCVKKSNQFALVVKKDGALAQKAMAIKGE